MTTKAVYHIINTFTIKFLIKKQFFNRGQLRSLFFYAKNQKTVFPSFRNKNQNLIYSPIKIQEITKNHKTKERIKNCNHKQFFISGGKKYGKIKRTHWN